MATTDVIPQFSHAFLQTLLEETCDRLPGTATMVCGDLLLDEYIWGDAERISPEAPVPVVRIAREEIRLGGAANVGLNIAALGGRPLLVGVTGEDRTGQQLRDLWGNLGHDPKGILAEPGRVTPRKSRILAGSQQMLRVDREDAEPAALEIEGALAKAIATAMGEAEAGLFSDYQKGTFPPSSRRPVRDPRLPQAALAAAPGRPLLANPKPASAHYFDGVRLLSLNRSEALGLLHASDRHTDLDEAGPRLREALQVPELLITRGAQGMTLFHELGGQLHIPAVASEVFDVTGAGDTVLAALGLALGSGAPILAAALLATYAAGVVVRKVGVATAACGEIMDLVRARPIEPRLVPSHTHPAPPGEASPWWGVGG
ncbi:MAG TPA: PfkB family carbohydrate kinase [bacterium]|nr:PfkB family carbohydrate kinase [bacterium]